MIRNRLQGVFPPALRIALLAGVVAMPVVAPVVAPIAAFAESKSHASPKAGKGSDAEPAKTEETPKPALYFKMDWFMMPVVTNAGNRPRTVPGTLFVEVKNEADATPVCVFEPRVRDALLQDLFKTPPLAKKGKFESAEINARLLGVANGALDKGRLANVWLVSGVARKREEVLKKLPFDEVETCAAVREAENRRRESQKSGGGG